MQQDLWNLIQKLFPKHGHLTLVKNSSIFHFWEQSQRHHSIYCLKHSEFQVYLVTYLHTNHSITAIQIVTNCSCSRVPAQQAVGHWLDRWVQSPQSVHMDSSYAWETGKVKLTSSLTQGVPQQSWHTAADTLCSPECSGQQIMAPHLSRFFLACSASHGIVIEPNTHIHLVFLSRLTDKLFCQWSRWEKNVIVRDVHAHLSPPIHHKVLIICRMFFPRWNRGRVYYMDLRQMSGPHVHHQQSSRTSQE